MIKSTIICFFRNSFQANRSFPGPQAQSNSNKDQDVRYGSYMTIKTHLMSFKWASWSVITENTAKQVVILNTTTWTGPKTGKQEGSQGTPRPVHKKRSKSQPEAWQIQRRVRHAVCVCVSVRHGRTAYLPPPWRGCWVVYWWTSAPLTPPDQPLRSPARLNEH